MAINPIPKRQHIRETRRTNKIPWTLLPRTRNISVYGTMQPIEPPPAEQIL